MLKKLLAAAALAAVLAYGGLPESANATVIVNSLVGGAPTGVTFENFDSLPLGAGGGLTPSGITVSFATDGQAVQGALAGKYAPPYLSNNNGLPFGDPNNGSDTTTYLTSGIGGVTLALPGQEKYFGILWGSVDKYNTLQLFDGATLVGTVTGADVTASANGDQGALGTFYVNLNSDIAFNTVTMSSSQYAFEADNVAFDRVEHIPEPGTLALLGVPLLGLGFVTNRRRGRRQNLPV